MASSGMLRRVVLARADVSEEFSASIIRVTRIGELGITLAVSLKSCHYTNLLPFLVSNTKLHFYRIISVTFGSKE
jgi:hypothetical protein